MHPLNASNPGAIPHRSCWLRAHDVEKFLEMPQQHQDARLSGLAPWLPSPAPPSHLVDSQGSAGTANQLYNGNCPV